ncbi:hypothetical protein MSAR_00760 [Mycolicibacterium sarraceniae]|uniref:Uncharacterized protein n=1 Tax=Mycolicibacterium sarraceniae TaxID=1534348 RepID=A0A7I7SK85_9MYCO|nr:hypothetical protein MSAR_00760 [Mycolicibacterium sarraceniae]
MSLHGNTFQVDTALIGRRVELVFSPFDLETIEVRYREVRYGRAVPHIITRHTHPKARPETPEPAPAATGIDYLALTAQTHHEQIRADHRIGYNALFATPPPRVPTARSPDNSASTTSPALTTRMGCRREYRTAATVLRLHPDALRPRSGPRDAAPPPRPQRSRRPDLLVCGPACDRGHHREVGAGKTVAIRAATAALDPARHVIIYLPNPSVGVRGMLHHIVTALGRVPSFYTATLAPQAAEALAAEHAERGRTPSWSSTKPTCSTTPKWKRSACSPTTTWTPGHPSPPCSSGNPPCGIACVWACWPHSISASRCATRSPAWPPADTADYIGHHATIAGRTDTLFSDDAITLIHNAARGYPRAVNNLAVHPLTAAFAAKAAIVDEKAARIAVTETGHD